MKYKKIVGWIQIVLGAIMGLYSYYKLNIDFRLDIGELTGNFNIFVGHQLELIKVTILVIFILIVLQGIINVKSKD